MCSDEEKAKVMAGIEKEMGSHGQEKDDYTWLFKTKNKNKDKKSKTGNQYLQFWSVSRRHPAINLVTLTTPCTPSERLPPPVVPRHTGGVSAAAGSEAHAPRRKGERASGRSVTCDTKARMVQSSRQRFVAFGVGGHRPWGRSSATVRQSRSMSSPKRTACT